VIASGSTRDAGTAAWQEPLLFLTEENPFPPVGGRRTRDATLIQRLALRGPVEVLTFQTTDAETSVHLPETITTTFVHRKLPLWVEHLRSLIRPRGLEGLCVNMVAALKARAASRGRLLWVSRLEMAQYIPLARSLGYRIVLDEHHVESERRMDEAVISPARWAHTLSAWQASRLEENYAEGADHLVTASELAASRLRKAVPQAKISVIPTTIDSSQFSPLAETRGKTLLFSGLLNRPANLEALEWFGHEILPRIRARLGARLPDIVVAGRNPTPQLISRLQEWGVRVHADPPSIRPLLEEAAIVFLPIRTGDAGHLRILEAMAAGRPVVTTGKGAAGLLLTPTVDAFVTETPDAFAMALVKLLENREVYEQIRTNALATARTRYDISSTDQLIRALSLSG